MGFRLAPKSMTLDDLELDGDFFSRINLTLHFSFWKTFSPRPLPGLHPWKPMVDFRPPDIPTRATSNKMSTRRLCRKFKWFHVEFQITKKRLHLYMFIVINVYNTEQLLPESKQQYSVYTDLVRAGRL